MVTVPQKKLWKLLQRPSYRTGREYCLALVAHGYRPSDWIIDIAEGLYFSDSLVIWPLPLVRVSLAEVGFSGPTKLEDFYRTAKGIGFETCSPEVALALRFNYDEQPTGEWLRIAVEMDSMIDSNNVPHLPKLGAALKRFYLETYWAYPHAIFHPHNEFVMIDRRIQGDTNAVTEA